MLFYLKIKWINYIIQIYIYIWIRINNIKAFCLFSNEFIFFIWKKISNKLENNLKKERKIIYNNNILQVNSLKKLLKTLMFLLLLLFIISYATIFEFFSKIWCFFKNSVTLHINRSIIKKVYERKKDLNNLRNYFPVLLFT